MYGGKVLERADRRTLFFGSHNPYTEGLLQSLPASGGERERLRPIPGQPPSLLNPPPGCPFEPRCPYAFDKCAQMPPLDPAGDEPGHLSACWLPRDQAARAEARERVLQSEPASPAGA
jgi:oligopeptide/dipeptide ABC transporter ATP-binding protein